MKYLYMDHFAIHKQDFEIGIDSVVPIPLAKESKGVREGRIKVNEDEAAVSVMSVGGRREEVGGEGGERMTASVVARICMDLTS